MKIDINKVELKLSDTDDPIASKIKWTPLQEGGTNFKSRSVSKTDSGNLQITPSIYMYAFCMAFFCSGLYIMINGAISLDILDILFGLAFIFIPLKLAAHSLRVLVIDKRKANIYRKKNLVLDLLDRTEFPTIPFNNIHAIQLIGEHIRSSNYGSGSSSN